MVVAGVDETDFVKIPGVDGNFNEIGWGSRMGGPGF